MVLADRFLVTFVVSLSGCSCRSGAGHIVASGLRCGSGGAGGRLRKRHDTGQCKSQREGHEFLHASDLLETTIEVGATQV